MTILAYLIASYLEGVLIGLAVVIANLAVLHTILLLNGWELDIGKKGQS